MKYIPTRAAIAIIVTVVCLLLLFNFKTPDTTAIRQRVIATPTGSAQSATASSAPTPSTSSSPTSSAPTPTPASQWRNGTFTGQDFPNQFGDVQVAVVISGGKITDVNALQMPNDRPRSAYISQQVTPWLHDEVLQAQSAQIDGISGATYTSYSYAQSVQSALDQAHA